MDSGCVRTQNAHSAPRNYVFGFPDLCGIPLEDIMRKYLRSLAAVLVLAMLAGLCCGAASAEDGGKLYLTVSSITFSVVGESENICVGTAKAEDITWISEDPDVVSVENGVLTATGVGTTVIRAELDDQKWEVTAGCLAKTAAELEAMDPEILAEPKRLPPNTGWDPKPYFQDVALIGDSISYIFGQNERMSNQLGNPLFLARGGCSINGFVKYYKNLFFRGEEMHLEDAVAASGVKKIYIMLGQNDLGYMEIQETLDNYAKMLDNIRAASPDIEVYIQTCSQEYAELSPTNARNLKIYEFNQCLPEFAKEQNAKLVDIAPYLESHRQRLAPIYSQDFEIHVNDVGCLVWGQVLSNFAELEEMGAV